MTTTIAIVLAGCLMLLSVTPLWAEESADYPLHAGFALGFASADSDCDYYKF